MAIPTILQGDTSSIIRLKVEDGDYTNCVLDVAFHGIVKRFEEFQGGDEISLEWSPEETKNFPLGASILTMTVRRGDFVRSLPFAKIKVTDAPSEVYESTITIAPNLFDLPSLSNDDTPSDVKAAVNTIIDTLRGRIGCIALFLSTVAFGELTPETKFDDIPGSTTISNIVASAGVTMGGGVAGTDGEAVTNIVNGMIIFKRDMYDLSFGGEYCWEITEGEDVTIAPYQIDNNYYFKGNFALHKWYKVVEIYDATTKQYKVIFSTHGMTPTSPPGITKEVTSDAAITSFDFGTIKGVKKRFPKDTIALKSDLPTEEKIKAIANTALNQIYDEKLGVTWQGIMYNGCLYYVASTNTNTTVIK